MSDVRRSMKALVRVSALAVVVLASLGGDCDPKGRDFFARINGGLDPTTGDIFGRVTVDGSPRSGVTVTLRRGGTVIGTTITDGNGEYKFLELDPGTHAVSIGEVPGADCPGEQTATVFEDDETEVNFACTTPQPQTGTVTGTVTVNGAGESGVTVTLRMGETTIGTTTTGTGGTYAFQEVPTGTKTVVITPPSEATCEPAQQDVTVTADGTVTADFACTRSSGDFIVSLTSPPPGWNHDMPMDSSLECKVIRTTPAQPGATYSAMTTGPTEGGASGVLTPQPVTGTLDALGRAELQVRINRLGTYVNVVTVTSGGLQQSATASVTVTSAANSCPLVSSSIRFKRDVVSLLPDEIRPLGLRPVAFRYLEPWGDPDTPQLGLIAEEVAEVYPQAVVLDGRGRPEAIDYRALTARLVEAIEERALRAAEAGIERLADGF